MGAQDLDPSHGLNGPLRAKPSAANGVQPSEPPSEPGPAPGVEWGPLGPLGPARSREMQRVRKMWVIELT